MRGLEYSAAAPDHLNRQSPAELCETRKTSIAASLETVALPQPRRQGTREVSKSRIAITVRPGPNVKLFVLDPEPVGTGAADDLVRKTAVHALPTKENAGGGRRHSLTISWDAAGADSGLCNFVIAASVAIQHRGTSLLFSHTHQGDRLRDWAAVTRQIIESHGGNPTTSQPLRRHWLRSRRS